MARQGKPPPLPVISTLLLLVMLIFCLRSLFRTDTIGWRNYQDSPEFITVTMVGAESSQLGLRLFYDQRLTPARRVTEVNQLVDIEPPGPHVSSRRLGAVPSLVRWVGLGLEREVDDRPQSFKNLASITIPLWLLAAACAVAPIRYVIERRRRRTIAPLIEAESTGAARAKGSHMRIATVGAMLCGVAIGAVVTSLVARRIARHNIATTAKAPASQPELPPIHPIVGTWRIKLSPLVASYTFANNHRFVFSLRGVPGALGGVGEHRAEGTWQVQGDTLTMHNTSSSSDYTVVGEDESARIISVKPDWLVLENVNRKGRPERLQFERVRPFANGRFDNPVLLGEWRSEQFALELLDSGDASMTIRRVESRQTLTQTGQWSQNGNELRLMFDRIRQQQIGVADDERTLPEPSEAVYEILAARDRNMLLLQPIKPQPGQILTFYRIN